jgi:DNA-binding NtrC family response regulator
MRRGTFREDLYYRLRESVLRVPPLRERLEDLPLLVEHCRRRFNARYGLAIDGVTPTAARALAAYPWPGNVRELEAVLREAMVLQGRGWLRAEDLALPAPEGEAAPLTTVPGPPRDRGPPSAHARAGGAPDGVSTSELARAAGVGLTLARAELGALAAAGALRRTGAGRAVRYVRP